MNVVTDRGATGRGAKILPCVPIIAGQIYTAVLGSLGSAECDAQARDDLLCLIDDHVSETWTDAGRNVRSVDALETNAPIVALRSLTLDVFGHCRWPVIPRDWLAYKSSALMHAFVEATAVIESVYLAVPPMIAHGRKVAQGVALLALLACQDREQDGDYLGQLKALAQVFYGERTGEPSTIRPHIVSTRRFLRIKLRILQQQGKLADRPGLDVAMSQAIDAAGLLLPDPQGPVDPGVN